MAKPINLFTIGFTQKSAETFFTLLSDSGVKRVIDTRLNNVSQLAGFAKKKDLVYFLKEICDIDYVHLPELAPTKDLLNRYKKKQMSWEDYEHQFNQLMSQRQPERQFDAEILRDSCLLCSEPTPHHCHRRLVAEHFQQTLSEAIAIQHL